MDGSSSLRVALLAVTLTVVGVRTDSTSTRLPGYGGVLPMPAVADDDADPLDLAALRHVDGGADHGRVLYAAGHTVKPVDRAASTRAHRPCPQQLVQTRAGAAGPTT